MFCKSKIFVLAYHSVADCEYKHSVSPRDFERQMAYVKKRFITLSLDEFIAVVDGKKTIDRDAVLVTFDDGIEDNYTNAYPILKKYDIPSIIFLTTCFVSKIHGGGVHKFQFLSWEQMKKLESKGLVKIENHTHSHPLLASLKERELDEELEVSNALIWQNLQKQCCALAYPKGDYNDEVIEKVKEKFILAFTTDGGYVDMCNFHRYKIPRILISKDVNFIKFRMVLSASFWYLKKIKMFLQSL
jgi:peptidoglycan/xylan/chitin deacetylase (PgdA/CDA1 family)